jgi:ribonuclease E
VVEGHIVEVENAANNAGNTARIRILDVDDADDYVLAEMITGGVAAADKKKRRRGGRRKTELTATEQAKQLRELAEEAARFTASRAPIGITSVTEEEEAEDQELLAERRGEKQADAIIIAEGEVQRSEGDGQHKRRRRRGRRGRGGQGEQGAPQQQQQPHPQPQQNERPPQRFASPAPPADEASAQPRSFEHAAAGHGPESEGQRRRRRRRGRRGRGRGGEGQPQGFPQSDRGGVEPLTGGLPSSPAVPDRHIFRVDSDGKAQSTGATAPREPSRAITPMRRAHPAVDAPPPSLTVPEMRPKKTKPARPRRAASGGIAGELEGTEMTALPPAKTTRVARKKAAPAEEPVTTVVAAKPKRAPRKKADAAAEASGVKKPAVRKRSTTAKTTAKKKK